MKRSPSLIAWTLALAAGMVLPSLATAQAKPVVAVLYFDNNSIGKDRADYDGLGKGIADLLINDMAANPSLRVVERDRLQAVLQEQNLAKAGQLDNETAVRVGKLLGAQYMITGGFMNANGTMVLTSRVINVETSAIMNPVKLQTKDQDVLGFIAQLSTKLNGEMKLPPMPRRVGEVKPAGEPATQVAEAKTEAAHAAKTQAKLDWKTALLYSKALEEQDNGNRSKAVEYYRQVLSKFPDFGPAKANLDKVQKAGA